MAADINEKIEKQLRQDNKADQKTVKILLLGMSCLSRFQKITTLPFEPTDHDLFL